jgi:hypothetical protein
VNEVQALSAFGGGAHSQIPTPTDSHAKREEEPSNLYRRTDALA